MKEPTKVELGNKDSVKRIEDIFVRTIEKSLKFHEEDPENSCGMTINLSDNFGSELTRPKNGVKSLFGTIEPHTDKEIEEHFDISTSELMDYAKYIGFEYEPQKGEESWAWRWSLSGFRSDQYITQLVQLDLLKRKM